MHESGNSALEFTDLLKRKAPAYLDLLTANCDSEFDAAIDALLEKALDHLETNKTNYRTLEEVGLSGVLTAYLTIPGLTVTQEAHSNGHVDLTLIADHCTPMRKKLGEAKIYKGPAYHVKGLHQLLGRYSTGREGSGFLVVYYRTADVKTLVKKLRDEMDASLPCRQSGPAADHQLKWSFLTQHAHGSGEKVRVEHVGCNLYIVE